MPEIVGKEKIVKEDGFLYYIKAGQVWVSPMKHNKTGKKHRVGTEEIKTEKGFMYFVGKSGFIERAPRKSRAKKA
jgi:hypothetical protein